MSIEVIDPASAAGIASAALDQTLTALRQTTAQAQAATTSATKVAAAQAAITAMLQAVGVNHRWTGTALQIMLPDGSYGVAVDLRGPQGAPGQTPTFSAGQVTSGASPAVAIHTGDPLNPIVDYVLPKGDKGDKGDPGVAGAGTVTHTGAPAPGDIAVFGADGDHIGSGGTLSAFGVSLVGAVSAVAVKALLAISVADVSGAQAALGFTPENIANKGAANGYAPLDNTGKVLEAYLPAAVLGDLQYQASWNAATNVPAIPAAASGNKGWFYVVGTAGSTSIATPQGAVTDWKVGDWLVSNGTTWDKIDNTDQVVSVAGLAGAITAAALKSALAIVSSDLTDATAIGKTLLTAASASAAKSALAIAAGDVSGLGNAATKNVGTTTGTVAAGDDARFSATAASFPVSGIVAKSSAYTILAADKGKMFDLTGSFILTLPAASGATSSAPLYYHFRKRDGSGVCAVTCAGSDTFASGLTSVNLYQEDMTLVSFGGAWYSPPGGRKRGLVDIGTTAIASAVASVNVTTGFFDPELRDMLFDLVGITPSAAAGLGVKVTKGGGVAQVANYSYSEIYASSSTAVASVGNISISSIGISYGSSVAASGTVEFKNFGTSNDDQPILFQTYGHGLALGYMSGMGLTCTTGAIDGVIFSPSAGNLTAGKFRQKGYRP